MWLFISSNAMFFIFNELIIPCFEKSILSTPTMYRIEVVELSLSVLQVGHG
jgi:hypothetical protein